MHLKPTLALQRSIYSVSGARASGSGRLARVLCTKCARVPANEIGDAGAAAFARVIMTNNIVELRLTGTRNLVFFSALLWSRAGSNKVPGSNVGYQGATAIADALKQSTSVTIVDLTGACLGLESNRSFFHMHEYLTLSSARCVW